MSKLTVNLALPIPVLDHGYVWHKGHLGDDLKALEWARMSTGRPTGENEAQDDRTREFLWRSGHVSPFEGPVLELEVMAPIFVLREWMRHDQHFNEMSGRYTVMPDLYYFPGEDRLRHGGQDPIRKQGSGHPMSEGDVAWFEAGSREVVNFAREFYEAADARGFARELDRIVLPLNQYSKIRVQTTLRNWFFFLKSRLGEGAQWEIRQYASAVRCIVEQIYPKAWAVFEEHTLEGVSLSRTEKLAVARFIKAASSPGFGIGWAGEACGLDDAGISRLVTKLGLRQGDE